MQNDSMMQIYFRVITHEFSPDIGYQTRQYLLNELKHVGIHNITFHEFIPYWKNPRLGEFTCQCTATVSLPQIQQLFATDWQFDTADIRWSRIHIPTACFLWISN